MVNSKVNYRNSSGIQVYDLDSNTLAQIISDGFGDYVDGEYILHRINLYCISQQPPDLAQLDRFARQSMAVGFAKYCDAWQWAAARSICNDAIDGVNFLQADYDLVDGMLPS